MVSVIVPNYNHASFIEQRIDTILDQTWQNLELIILDDKSVDNSKEIVENYRAHPKVAHIIYNPVNSGSPFKQWQKGIELAKGEYVWIAESDDFSDVHFLERVMNCIGQYKVDVCFTNSYKFSDGGICGEMFESTNNAPVVLNGEEVVKNWIIHSEGIKIGNTSAAVFSRKLALSVKEQIGLANYVLAGDYAFWACALRNIKVCVINEKLNYYRLHNKNVSRVAKDKQRLITSLSERIKVNNYIKDKIILSGTEKNILAYRNKDMSLKIISLRFPLLQTLRQGFTNLKKLLVR